MTWLRDLGVLLGQKVVAEWAARNGSHGYSRSYAMWRPKTRPLIWLMSKLNRRVNNLLISPRPKQNEQCFTRKERRVEVPSYTKRAGRCPGRDISAFRITSGSS